MRIRVLGAHNLESRSTSLPGLLVDDVLALDAGGVTTALALEEQMRIQAVLLTHRHYDHLKALPLLAFAGYGRGDTVQVYGPADTLDSVEEHLLGSGMYPDFRIRPSPERPRLSLHRIDPYRPLVAAGHQVLPVPVPHGAPAVGYCLTSESGRSFFYTGDAGAGLAGAWDTVQPDLLVVEVTFPDSMRETALEVGHLTPSLLAAEIQPLSRAGRGYPRVIAVHMDPSLEGDIRSDLDRASASTGAEITPARAGMVLEV